MGFDAPRCARNHAIMAALGVHPLPEGHHPVPGQDRQRLGGSVQCGHSGEGSLRTQTVRDCSDRPGCPVRDIRHYAALVSGDEATVADRVALLEAHRARVLARIEELSRDLATVDYK